MAMLPGLKEALKSEAAERANLASMKSRIDRAAQDKAAALAKRKRAVEKVAAGGVASEATEIDQAVQAAESTISVLSEAAIMAEGRVRDAEHRTETILRAELGRRASIVQGEYDQAEASVEAAFVARRLTEQKLRAAQQAVALPPSNLRLMFDLRCLKRN